MIFAIRTTSGREDMVIDMVSSKIKNEGLEIKTLFHPAEIKGYIFAEGQEGAVHKAVQGLMHIKGIINKPVNLEEIRHFLEVKKTRMRIDENDIVEIIGGPFKGERGKITRIDKVKDEVTIELLDASIPIPVTITTEFIKVLKKEEKAEEAKEEVRADKETGEEIKEKTRKLDIEAMRKESIERVFKDESSEEPTEAEPIKEEVPVQEEKPQEEAQAEKPKGETKEEKPEEEGVEQQKEEPKPQEGKPSEEEKEVPTSLLEELEIEEKKKKKDSKEE